MNKNVPKLRFKEFEGEWLNQTLDSFLEFYTTNSFSRDCLNMNDGKVNNIHYGDIHMKFPTILNLQKAKVPFINTDVDISKIKDESYCQNGDLVIADASEDYNDIGKAIEIQNIADNKVIAGLHTILARDSKGITAPKFKGYMMLNETVRKQIKVLAAGAKVLGISKSNLAKVKVNIPSVQEQEKIADFFTILDSLIEEQDGKVSDLELYKKGMMQKIFSQEIRFKDENGCNYPEWTKQKLGDISRIIMGQSPSSAAYNENNEGLPLVQGNADINNRVTTPRIYTNEITKTCELKDIIMSVRAPVGTIAIANQVCCIGRGVCAIKSNYNQNYLYQVLLEKESKWSKISQGSTFESINSNDIKSLIVNLPSFQEQNKIAEILSNMDNLIEEEKKNLDDLKEMKKGLLQEMFI